MRSFRFVTASVCLSFLAACGGGGGGDATTAPSTGNQNPGGADGATKMTATIDGRAWNGSTGATAIQIDPVGGRYLVTGIELATSTSVVLAFGDVSGPGTYPLGVDNVTVAGGFAGVTNLNGQTWNTPFSGAAGTITITSLTAKRVAGTFSFTASSPVGGATGSRAVTSGVFDVPFNKDATIRALPDSVGSKMSATLNGQVWNAAIASGQTANGFIAISGINDKQSILFTIAQPAAAGTYPLSYTSPNFLWAIDPNAVKPAGAQCCWGVTGDAGTITFTTVTKTRTKGTFSITLSPQAGTAARGQLTISGGTFDLGMYHTP